MWVRIEIVFADEAFIGTKKYRVTRPFIAGLQAWQALYCRCEITADSNRRCKVSPRKGKIIVAYSNPTSVPRLIERLLVFLGSTIYLSFETLKSSVLFDIFEKVETMEVSSVIFEKRKEREKKTDPRGKISHRIESRSGTFDRFPWK